jgi:DNA-binding transcriptional regulator YiaG
VAEKTATIGICDFCGGPIPAHLWYTRRGPRLHCSLDCRNAANSRAGAPIRSEKAKERVERGEWVNPRSTMTPEQISAAQSHASRTARSREVAEGRWRNPALDDQAREKLSQPRTHGDNPLLHSALEKLRRGTMADLTPDERQAHRDYRRQLNHVHADESRAYHRRRYRERMQTATGQARERARWERERERMAQRSPNQRLIDARKAAGLSQQALAEKVGVAQGTVAKWERFGAVPREDAVRQRVEELLGKVF